MVEVVENAVEEVAAATAVEGEVVSVTTECGGAEVATEELGGPEG